MSGSILQQIWWQPSYRFVIVDVEVDMVVFIWCAGNNLVVTISSEQWNQLTNEYDYIQV